MPRQSKGPRLQLFGPDRTHGATAKNSLRSYKWYIIDRVDGRRVERATGYGLDDQASALEALAEYARGKEARPDDGRLTVAHALGVYGQQHLQKNNKPSLKDFLLRLPKLNEGFGHIVIGKLTTADVEAYKAWRRETGVLGYAGPGRPGERIRDVKNSSLRRELTDLRSALNFFYKSGMTTQPCPYFELPAGGEGTIRWLTHSEAALLMRAARASPKARQYLPLFMNISLWTAQRKRAVLGLQWEPNEEGGHVDLERGVMHFPPEGRAQTKKRKTRCVIPARSILMLRAARRRTKRYVIERPGRPHERLDDIANSFETACVAAGLEMEGVRRVVPHTLGHTSITWMLERGLSAHEVSRFTGKSVQIIQDRYGHHSDELLTRVARGR